MSDVHGRKRERTSAEAIKARREKEAEKIKEYRDLVEQCRSQIKNEQYDEDTLLLTTRILQQNPDFYTIWNYRRKVLLRGILERDAAKDRPVFCKELDFFMQVIRINPKSYWLWNHRVWCLQTMPDPDWKAELGLVEKMLAMDARNFHGWNYRRYVVKKLKAIATNEQEEAAIIKNEYNFTTKKIYDNFSNFSAWHQRSKLLPSIVAPLSMEEKNQKAREEFDLVKNAVYTDPNDQSAWLYYRWLIGHTPSEISVLGAFRLSGLDVISLVFSKNATLLKTPSVTTADGHSVSGQWCFSKQRSNTSSIYIFKPAETLTEDVTIRIPAKSVAAAHSIFDYSWEGAPVYLATDSSVADIVISNLKNMTIFSGARFTDLIEDFPSSWYTLDRTELLGEEIQAIRDLLEEEPDSRWALETLAHFLEQLKLCDATANVQNINTEIAGIFDRLIDLDSHRRQRYQDAKNALKWSADSHAILEAYKKQDVSGPAAQLLLDAIRRELCG